MKRMKDSSVCLKFKSSHVEDNLHKIAIDYVDDEGTIPVIDFIVTDEQLLMLFMELGQTVKTKKEHNVTIGFEAANIEKD